MPAEIDRQRRAEEDRPHRRRSVIVSPSWRFSPPGSRWGGFSLSWSQLRALCKKSPTVQAIVNLRANQLASFAHAPRHKGDRGFEIVRADDPYRMSVHDRRVAEYCYQFLMGTGAMPSAERELTFADWLKAITRDLFILGMSATELVYDTEGRLAEFWPLDTATIEIQWAERYIPTTRYGQHLDQPVRYVQVVDGQIETEYAADELMLIRLNPVTDIENGGYAQGYAEQAIDWIAAEVLALQYNSNYFDQGSVPPGILVLMGGLSQEALDDLNTMWQTDVTGVVGQHKPVAIAVEEGKGVSWIPMKNSNRDMEMGDFLDKLTTKICGVFNTEPLEIGQRSAASSGGMFSSDNTAAKIDLSRDKGLLPLLDLTQLHINRHLMPVLAPGYIFRWTGLDVENERARVEYLNTQLIGGALTAREWRRAMGLDEVPPGVEANAVWLDAPANPHLVAIWQAEMAQRGLLPPPAKGAADALNRVELAHDQGVPDEAHRIDVIRRQSEAPTPEDVAAHAAQQEMLAKRQYRLDQQRKGHWHTD